MKFHYLLLLMSLSSILSYGHQFKCINGGQIISIDSLENIKKEAGFIRPDNLYIQYTGRINYSNPEGPTFWAPGVYFRFKISGNKCGIVISDEGPDNSNYNHLAVIIDDHQPMKFQLNSLISIIDISELLDDDEHIITVCKNTEANIGYVQFNGIICDSLLPLPAKPKRKFEFFGNSITCGTGADTSYIPCGAGVWHDQHNAYMSYGPLVARSFNAQWHLTSISGIGIIHSCCENDFLMKDVYDKISLLKDTEPWDFSSYIPDVVTICLGQNDGIQDSVEFIQAYVELIDKIRIRYQDAEIVCLLSPMANQELRDVQTKQISAVVNIFKDSGDNKIHKYFFKKIYSGGCDWHPSLEEHAEIAEELRVFLETILDW